MKLKDITLDSVQPLSNREIVSIHRRIHQLYTLAIAKKSNKEYVGLLVKSHRIVSNEMKKRKLQHRTPIPKSYSLELFLQSL
jgi:hypothetical protein